METLAELPPLIRFGFLWNRFGPRGRGYVPRKIGKLYNPDADYIIETAHGAKLRIELENLEAYASIYNAQGIWEPHVLSTLRSHAAKERSVLRHRGQCRIGDDGHQHAARRNGGDLRV